jgi:hypothetical protein
MEFQLEHVPLPAPLELGYVLLAQHSRQRRVPGRVGLQSRHQAERDGEGGSLEQNDLQLESRLDSLAGRGERVHPIADLARFHEGGPPRTVV